MASKKKNGSKKGSTSDESMAIRATGACIMSGEINSTFGPDPLDEEHTPPSDLPWPDDALQSIEIKIKIIPRLVPFVGYSMQFNDGPELWAEEAGWRLDDNDKIDWAKTMESLRGKHAYIQDYIEDVLLKAIGSLVSESGGYDMPAWKVEEELSDSKSLDMQEVRRLEIERGKIIEQRKRDFEANNPGVPFDFDEAMKDVPRPELTFSQSILRRDLKNARSRLLRSRSWKYEFTQGRVLRLNPTTIRFFLAQYEKAIPRWNRIRGLYDQRRPQRAKALFSSDAIEERAKITEEWRREAAAEFGSTLRHFIEEFGSYLVDDLLQAVTNEESQEYIHPSRLAIVEAGRLAFKRQGLHFTVKDANDLFKLLRECKRRDIELRRYAKVPLST